MPVNRTTFFCTVEVHEMDDLDTMILKTFGEIQRIFIICLFTGGIALAHFYNLAVPNSYRWNYLNHGLIDAFERRRYNAKMKNLF